MSPGEQSAQGRSVNFDIYVGSKENLHYDHQVRVVARDDFGTAATAGYTLRLEPPAGFLLPRYDDSRSQVGATALRETDGTLLRTMAYNTVLVEVRTEGLVGRVDYFWSPTPVNETRESSDIDKTVFRMLVSGDSNDIESYEGLLVRVHAIDEIGQSLSLEKYVDAVTEVEEAESQARYP
jgi:hypothetical protein